MNNLEEVRSKISKKYQGIYTYEMAKEDPSKPLLTAVYNKASNSIFLFANSIRVDIYLPIKESLSLNE